MTGSSGWNVWNFSMATCVGQQEEEAVIGLIKIQVVFLSKGVTNGTPPPWYFYEQVNIKFCTFMSKGILQLCIYRK